MLSVKYLFLNNIGSYWGSNNKKNLILNDNETFFCSKKLCKLQYLNIWPLEKHFNLQFTIKKIFEKCSNHIKLKYYFIINDIYLLLNK